MEDLGLITEILVPLLSDKHVPLRVIAFIGEVITADAKLKDRGEGKTVRADLDAMVKVFDAYKVLQEEAGFSVCDFNARG